MKVLILFASLLALGAKECSLKRLTALPKCVQQKIDSIKAQPKWNPPAQVDEYLYKGKRVFAFSSNCCDQYNPVFDEDCNYICAPSGGMTGKGDRKYEDFAAAQSQLIQSSLNNKSILKLECSCNLSEGLN